MHHGKSCCYGYLQPCDTTDVQTCPASLINWRRSLSLMILRHEYYGKNWIMYFYLFTSLLDTTIDKWGIFLSSFGWTAPLKTYALKSIRYSNFPVEESKHCYECVCPLFTTPLPSTQLQLNTVWHPQQPKNPTTNERFPVPPRSKTTQAFGSSSSLMKWVHTIQSPTSIQMENTRALSRVVEDDFFVLAPQRHGRGVGGGDGWTHE